MQSPPWLAGSLTGQLTDWLTDWMTDWLQINKHSVSLDEGKLIWGQADRDAAVAKAEPKPITNAELATQMAALQAQLSKLAAQLAAKTAAEGDS